MKLGQRLVAAGLLLGLAGPGCGNGGSQTAVRVVVDGQNLTSTEQSAVRSIWLFVMGDGEGGTIPRMFSTTTGLLGQYVAVYKPHITSGALDITVTINDKDGNVLGTRMTRAIVLRGNEVVTRVAFGAGTDDGGVSPPPPDGGVADGAVSDGAVGDAALDLPAADGLPADGSVGDDGPLACSARACNAATADSCCPTGCTALTDLDCAGCGNGHLDPGEICDPLDSCKTVCPPVGCQLFSLTGAGTCQASCEAAGMQAMCVNGDGCCPTGCTSASDTDCSAMCGNGLVEGTEICDGNCPSTCQPLGCQLRTMQGSATTCNAQCVNGGMQTLCASGDGCCPTGCEAATDSDCAVTCGNGKLDPGETCDGNCPTSCPAMGCTLRVLTGTASACNVSCVDAPSPQMACLNGDACCPTGCNNTNDNNCAARCGNSVVEMGETCDPQSACTTTMTSCVNNANTIVTMVGSPAQCTFACTRKQRTCGPVDTYCPTNVTCGPTADSDCAGCGNSRIETGETCDPPATCMSQMTACTSDKDNVRVSSGSTAACTYKCTTTTRVCGAADGFCPTGCGPAADPDCAGCGNGKIETALGETCDVAPASTLCTTFSCNDNNPCTVDAKVVGADACHVTCTHTGITTCSLATPGDMCCPTNCNATNDTDCKAVCGNGIVEGGETCDPATSCAAITCPTPPACSTAVRNGTNATCNVACTTTPITACSGATTKDNCCPGGGLATCNATNDADCAPRCGNGVLEGTETCETSMVATNKLCSSFTCTSTDACTISTTTGSTGTCNPVCTQTKITACSATADGCCPSGCNHTNDPDCAAKCGNGVIEPPTETCETGIANSCPTTCPMVGCSMPQLMNAGTCTAACVDTGMTQTTCKATADGCCPKGCTELNDGDCAPANDLCANAVDISKGGDFKFNLATAKQETQVGCTAEVNGKSELFYTFTLAADSAVYLDVYEGGTAVNAAIELYPGACPPKGQITSCDVGSGQKDCNTTGAAWPRIFQPNLAAGTYFVVVRALGTPNGVHTLRFQRVPTACVAGGALPPKKDDTTCSSDFNHYAPTCITSSARDRGYYLEKCPSVGLNVDTCGGQSANSDTVLQLASGSLDLVGQTCVAAPSGAFLECNDDAGTCKDATGLSVTPKSSLITGGAKSARGIVSVVVDIAAVAGASGCGAYTITSTVQ